MAVTFVSFTSPVQSGNASVGIGAPAGMAAGDLDVIYLTVKPSTATVATPTGWTVQVSDVVGTGTQGVDTGPQRIVVFSQEATGAGSSVTLSFSGHDTQVVTRHAYRVKARGGW